MKNTLLFALSIFVAACQDSTPPPSEPEPKTDSMPIPGTVVAADSMHVADLAPTEYFSVMLMTGEYTFRGTYNIEAHYGAHEETNEITFPRSKKGIKPSMKRKEGTNAFIIGFYHGDDTTFYDYYLIEGKRRGNRGEMKMKYLKGYSFE